MIGGLFVGGADGFAPGVGVVGVDVFVLGEGQGLHESLAEIGEGGGGFGLHLALGDSGEEASEGGAKIAGGYKAAGQVIGDLLARGLASKGLGRRGCDGEKQVPRCSRDDTGALAAIALAGLKTRHYNLRAWNAQRYGWSARRGMRQWRPSTNMKEHKEERSLERLADMEVSRKKD